MELPYSQARPAIGGEISRYLKALGRGDYGQSHFDRRARIGKIHDMLDLGPKIYLGAYTVYYEGMFRAIAEDVKDTARDGHGDHGEAAPTSVDEAVDEGIDRTLSVLKLTNLDQQVAMDTYLDSYTERIESEVDERRTQIERQTRSIDEISQTVQRLTDDDGPETAEAPELN